MVGETNGSALRKELERAAAELERELREHPDLAHVIEPVLERIREAIAKL